MPLLSQADYARQEGVSRQYIHKLVKKGVIPLHGDKIDSEEASVILQALENPSYQKVRLKKPSTEKASISNTTNQGDLSRQLLKTKLKNEQEKGKLLEIKAENEAGKLVDIERVRRDFFSIGRQVRNALQNIPDRLAATIATIDDEHRIHQLLSDEIRQTLTALSKPPVYGNTSDA